MGAKEENLRVARLARAVWGQYGAAILREWEEGQNKGKSKG